VLFKSLKFNRPRNTLDPGHYTIPIKDLFHALKSEFYSFSGFLVAFKRFAINALCGHRFRIWRNPVDHVSPAICLTTAPLV
jgi:hypothetical protein